MRIFTELEANNFLSISTLSDYQSNCVFFHVIHFFFRKLMSTNCKMVTLKLSALML